MELQSILTNSIQDLSQMSKSDVSKNLFGQIAWEEILRSGVFLEHRDHQLLERAQANLGVILDNQQDSKDLSKMLITIAENCTSNIAVQQYVFTRIEEILGLGADFTDADVEVFGSRHAPLFTNDGVNLIDSPFLRALSSPDLYLQQSASLGFACLLTVSEGQTATLIAWINSKLNASSPLGLPALSMLSRKPSARKLLIAAGAVNSVVGFLQKIGTNGNAQIIYELIFILWTLSLDSGSEPECLQAFLHSGAIPCAVDLFAAAPSRKVVRMSIGTLKNLAATEDDTCLTEMLSGNLLKLLDTMIQTSSHKQANDLEFESDVKTVYEIMNHNYRDLSTFDRWTSQVHSGSMRWGIVHTEKFWRENYKFAEANEFKPIKELITLLKSEDPNTVCIALYDMGEFARFYPNGKGIVSSLGGKDLAMQMISSDNPEIQSHALRCVSKVMHKLASTNSNVLASKRPPK